jgi:PAS domain-containing protein
LTLVRADGAGEPSEQDRELLRRLTRPLMRSLSLSIQLEFLRERASAAEATLAHLNIAVILLNGLQRVIYANPAAEDLLTGASPLTVRRGALVARGAQANRKLWAAVREATEKKASGGAELQIERENRRPLFVTVAPIGCENRFGAQFSNRARCAVFVKDAEAARNPGVSAIARHYGLTQA